MLKNEDKQWLKSQEDLEPNENVVKTFKWLLMKLEEDVRNNTYNHNRCESIDKYAVKMIQRKIMSEGNVYRFVLEAQGLN